MADYQIVNLNDVNSSSSQTDVDARFTRDILGSKDLGVSRFSYQPGFKAVMAHSHKVQEEIYVVLSGSGRLLLDQQVESIKEGDVIRVAPQVVRAFEAGNQGLSILAIGGNKPEGGDGQRFDAVWPD
jgi:uncharacterized cupin superfamily protein